MFAFESRNGASAVAGIRRGGQLWRLSVHGTDVDYCTPASSSLGAFLSVFVRRGPGSAR